MGHCDCHTNWDCGRRASAFGRLSADDAGVPGHALRVARAVLSLDAFQGLLRSLDGRTDGYDAAALLADVARVVAREAA